MQEVVFRKFYSSGLTPKTLIYAIYLSNGFIVGNNTSTSPDISQPQYIVIFSFCRTIYRSIFFRHFENFSIYLYSIIYLYRSFFVNFFVQHRNLIFKTYSVYFLWKFYYILSLLSPNLESKEVNHCISYIPDVYR